MIFDTILWFQAREKSLQQLCVTPLWKNWNKALTSTPLKHLWGELKRRVQARRYRTTSVANLTKALVAEWGKIPAASFQTLVESLFRRMEAVIAAD